MNEKTTKLLNKVAGIQVKDKHGPKFEIKDEERFFKNLMAKWKGSTPTNRGKMRKQMKHIVRLDG